MPVERASDAGQAISTFAPEQGLFERCLQPQCAAGCQREADATPEKLRHTTLATARLRFLFVAAKIWRHAGRTGISYSDQYQEQGLFERLMRRLRAMAPPGSSCAPVVEGALR